jgi:peptidoglycan/LPS O-acetylase OafA/YrhL
MQTYLPWLDLLRFVACVMVIVNHVNPFERAERIGHNGVGLFFSISGYLIGSILMNARGKPQWMARFYANRFLRIYPALLMALAFFGILLWAGFAKRPGTWEMFRDNLPYYLTFTAQLSPNAGDPFGIVWTLCVEEYFYLLLPIAFWLFGPRGTAVGLILLMVLTAEPGFHILPGTTEFGTWFIAPVNLLSGAVLATLRPQPREGFPWVGAIGLVAVVANASTGFFHPFGPVMGVVTTLTVWSFAVTRLEVPRSLKPMVLAGKWSYGIYLLHLPVCSASLRVCRDLGLESGGKVLYFTAAAVLATVWTAALAGIMYRLVEKPILASRPWVNERPWLRTIVAGLQVSLIPIGIVYWLAMGGWR